MRQDCECVYTSRMASDAKRENRNGVVIPPGMFSFQQNSESRRQVG